MRMKKLAVINEFSVEAVRDALQKLDDFDKLIVNGLNAFQLNEIEKIDPLLFGSIAGRISEGRWNPFSGMWCGGEEKISDENLARNALYSAQYFKENFGKKYRVFVGEKINNSSLAQIVYNAGYDACWFTAENEPCWLTSIDKSRILVAGGLDTVDVNDIDDEFINANEFGAVEEEVTAMFAMPLQLKTVALSDEKNLADDDEKILLNAEKIATQNGEKISEKIENIWIEKFLGNDIENDARNIIDGRDFDEKFITVDSDEVELVALKFAEDGSGDAVIRLKETAGKEKTLFVMCDALNAGFRCEIMPYELQTFSIDGEGFVKEIFISELINE